ncbi:hypothetical protein BO71DRAFT_413316 [Aspergillus ellipticus CBS 707.79]|uniref:Zn(2)-C6 fungal-type domain-containing protein n=1 Tax=Aspergillus ellipticus CBS 707.79 TaxID=1448320 RepID=A0A319CY35_9EURO|nr:hypothetical protein BO71DRAFT_338211 [Aspergillus ellipticus CBS 707.79]PYH89491.1 hypothetical protein BO71DRAFT_413316 [Aspergillus ellipticus CBS 707.79]
MPPPEPRQIKRPRLSLSCIVCRRRKVRCGREQPECANCVRMKENCLYKIMVRDDSTGQVHQVSPPPEDIHPGGRDPHPKDLTSSQSGNAIDQNDEPPPPPAAGPTAPLTAGGSRPRSSQTHGEEASSRSLLNTLSANPSPARSPNHRQVDMAHPTVPSWEEGPAREVTTEAATATRDASDVALTTTSTSTPYSVSLSNQVCSDYLSLRRGARARYIGQAFWGFVAGKEGLSDDFLDDNTNADPEFPPSHISSVGMFNILRSLPTKAVSDALLDVFLFGVWPLSPLVHFPTFRADYDIFWDWCRHNENNLPPEKVRHDPTFICLLFAVLYCGASAAPAASWTGASLQGLRKETTVNQLRSASETSLSLCQHLEHPTLNTMISTLLTRPFLDRPREQMRELVAVSTIIRLAQSIGLHREGPSWSGLSPVDREIRRRAWWHIVRLDVQSSISTGLPPCCGSEALDAVRMMADARDEDLSDLSPFFSPNSDRVSSSQSIAIRFAIGCSEAARLQSSIMARLQSGRGLTQNQLKELVAAAKTLQQKIDALIARIPSQGIPERGFIPSRLANASPSTHPSLYKDDATQPTVFAAWTGIMLTLLKFDIAILLQKPFLPPPDSSNPQSCKAWTSMAQLCVSYFRIILQVYQAPAFAPYMWFCGSYNGPLQCVFLTLIYLHCFKGGRETLLARYCVDEMIEHIVSHYQVAQPSSARACPDSDSEAGPSTARMPHAIQVLVDLHSRLDSHGGPDDHPRVQDYPMPSSSSSPSTTHTHTHTHRPHRNAKSTPPPPMIPGSKPGPPSNVFVAKSYLGRDLELASVADLESWSSSLVLESNDLFAHPDLMPSDYSVQAALGHPHSTAGLFE